MIIEDDGVPRFVQKIWYDYVPFYFRVRYFDGSTTNIDASYVMELLQKEPTKMQYLTAEKLAEFQWKLKNCS